MKTENLSTLKIHKLTQAQYEREREAGRLDAGALYLTPDETIVVEAGTEVPANAAQMKALTIGGETFEVVDEAARARIAVLEAEGGKGGGITEIARALLISILRNAVYASDQSANITALETALASSGSSGGGTGGGESSSISITKNGTVLTISGVSSISTVKQTGTILALA